MLINERSPSKLFDATAALLLEHPNLPINQFLQLRSNQQNAYIISGDTVIDKFQLGAVLGGNSGDGEKGSRRCFPMAANILGWPDFEIDEPYLRFCIM